MTKREHWPLNVRIKGNPYGLPVGKVMMARRKEGDGSPFPINVFPSYQFKDNEVEIVEILEGRADEESDSQD